ncbi:MAG: ribonuclease R [Bacilli bacterium]
MQEQILEILKEHDRAFSVDELNDLLQLNSLEEFKELLKNLNELEDNLKIYRTNKNNYMLFNNSHLKIGRMLANKKGYGFVDIEGDEDVFIAPINMNNAIHGDTVIVEITSKKGLQLEGRIVKIVNRKFKTMVGEYVEENGKGYIKLDEEKVKIKLHINREDSLGAMPGHKVLVKIGAKMKDNNYRGQVLKILGHKNDPGVDILSIVNKYGINDTFSDEVMAEVDKLPYEVSREEMVGRKDLREEKIFTIDGDDTKDIDDAISIKLLENGNYQLGVHIADVSYYVKEGSKLDEEAFDRGTSVYLADRVIPMLPHKLSNGICSLNPNVDRLAMSCVMEIDTKGNVVDYDIFESVIKSGIQMTYKKVNLFLEQNIVSEGYQDYTDELTKMADLAKILRVNKEARGYIDFDIDEPKIIVNENGEAIDVVKRERGVGEKLIEDFMIVANETVATHIYFMELPFVYRVHGEPNEEKINSFIKFVNFLGYNLNTKLKKITPKTMQQILQELKDKKEFHILSSLLLRSMQKAVYDKNNIGHFGLASKCYTHFTSPIRRYPDTTVHRLLRTYLFKNMMDNETVKYWDNKLVFLTEHSSQKERDAVECEREVDDMKMAEYMMKHIGEEYEGMVSSIVPFGMFIELPNLVEGLVRLDDMTDDHYIYIEDTYSLIGTKNKRGYRLGDKVRVRVKDANKYSKTVDFELVLNTTKEID